MDTEFSALLLLLPGSDAVIQVLALAIIAAIILTPLEYSVPAHPQPVIFRRGLLLDLAYWFVTPLLTRMFTGIILGLCLALFGGVYRYAAGEPLVITHGFGPLARQSTVAQALQVLLIADFIDYWTHRSLHTGPFWRIHAIHHSPEEMSWLSSSRVHPLNDLITRSSQTIPIVLLGYSPHAILGVVPLISFYVMFLHSNIRWDFGPLRWVLVSPAYHRWHHTSDAKGIDKNFAGIFPIWDLLFGTCYFPRALPKRYGLQGSKLPESIWCHLIFPFRGSNDDIIAGR